LGGVFSAKGTFSRENFRRKSTFGETPRVKDLRHATEERTRRPSRSSDLMRQLHGVNKVADLRLAEKEVSHEISRKRLAIVGGDGGATVYKRKERIGNRPLGSRGEKSQNAKEKKREDERRQEGRKSVFTPRGRGLGKRIEGIISQTLKKEEAKEAGNALLRGRETCTLKKCESPVLKWIRKKNGFNKHKGKTEQVS